MTSPRFIAFNLRRFLSELRPRFGRYRQAIRQPKIRRGISTNAVPLTYQPMIGEMPNASRSQGITAIVVSHSNIENAPNIEVEAAQSLALRR
jgi:hypothetical protein